MSAPWADTTHDLRDMAALRRIYELPTGASISKEADHVHPLYRPFIEASPWVAVSTLGPHGLDTSPRGDAPGFVEVADSHTLLLPDRRGNNRIDTLGNVVHDPRISLLFVVPGHRETLRVRGTARVSVHPELLRRFEVDGKPPRSVLVIAVATVFFQCGRAMLRSNLWDPARHAATVPLPTPGALLQALTHDAIDGAAYDAALPARQQATLY